jgi:hypothetical protein
MKIDSKNIDSLESLEDRIRELKAEAGEMEGQMDANVQHLKDKYLSMTFGSIFSKKISYKGIPLAVLGLLLEHEQFKNSIFGFADQLLDKASDGVKGLTEKLKRRKEQPKV